MWEACRVELAVPHGHAAPGDVWVGPGGKDSGGWGLVLLLHGAAAAKHQHQGTYDDAEHLVQGCVCVQACEVGWRVGWWVEGCMCEGGPTAPPQHGDAARRPMRVHAVHE